MPGQGDLQDWLRQLKNKAEQQQGRAPAQRPTASPRQKKQAPAVDWGAEISQRAQRLDDGGGSATDAALAQLREQERLERKSKESQRRQQAHERAAKRLEREKKQREDAEKARKDARARTQVQKRLKEQAERSRQDAVVHEPKKGSMRRLRTNLAASPKVLRQAMVFAEILGPPKCLKGTKALWEQM